MRALAVPVRVGIIGTGSMGKGLLYQCEATPGVECVAAADIRLERAVECARWIGSDPVVVDSVSGMTEAIRRGRFGVCDDGDLVAAADGIDVLVEASSSILEAGMFAEAGIRHGKHLVLMNAEVDLIFGPYLASLAHRHGVVYTSCDGDQHGVIKRLWDDVCFWGFDPVMAGNIKGFLDRYANPTSIVPEADKRRLDHRMATAYTDGTKLCVEMSLLANALGLGTLRPGMVGPRAAHVSEVLGLFDFQAIRDRELPVVDYILGAEPGGGVFAVAYHDDPYQRDMMAYYKMGAGPFYVFHRPYHLCHVEAVASIMETQLRGKSLLSPPAGFRTNVHAYAKRDLQCGERLDGVGGYTCYGLVEERSPAEADPRLPICLADDVALNRAIRKDEPILLPDVAVPRGRADFAMYALAEKASRECL